MIELINGIGLNYKIRNLEGNFPTKDEFKDVVIVDDMPTIKGKKRKKKEKPKPIVTEEESWRGQVVQTKYGPISIDRVLKPSVIELNASIPPLEGEDKDLFAQFYRDAHQGATRPITLKNLREMNTPEDNDVIDVNTRMLERMV